MHLETFSKIYLVIVAARPPSPSPSPSTRLARSILVSNPPRLDSAKQVIIDRLLPPCVCMLSPQASYARRNLSSRVLGLSGSRPLVLKNYSNSQAWTSLQRYSHDLLVSCSGMASVCVDRLVSYSTTHPHHLRANQGLDTAPWFLRHNCGCMGVNAPCIYTGLSVLHLRC